MIKLKAYTMMEMMVVMIITVLVSGFSFVVFGKMLQMNHTVRQMYTKNYSLYVFDRLLLTDMLVARVVEKTPEGFVCRYGTHDVHYTWQDQLVRVQGVVSDTLYALSAVQLEYGYADSLQTVIKEIKLSGMQEEEPFEMTYKKRYGAEFLMLQDEQGN